MEEVVKTARAWSFAGFVCLVAGFFGVQAYPDNGWLPVPLGIAFVVVAVFKLMTGLARLKSENYLWYRNRHPDICSDEEVKCYQCGSSRIGLRSLMNQTFLRAHVCNQCGTTLYHSPE